MALDRRPELTGRPREGEPGGAGRGRWQLTVAAAAVMLAAADTYVVVLALPNIMGGVGLGLDQLQQGAPIVSGFLLGYTVMLPFVGRLSDRRGRVPVLAGCLGVFAVGSALTASAHSLAQVVAGRAIQGLGGGGLVPVTLALVADLWPAERRGLPLGLVGAVQELGSVVGPLYGAVILRLAGWRAIFWVNLVAAAGLSLALRAGMPSRTRPDRAGPGRAGPTGWAGEGGRASRGGPARLTVSGKARPALLSLAGAAGLLALVAPAPLTDSVSWGTLYVPLVGSGPWAELTTPLALGGLVLAGVWLAWGAGLAAAHPEAPLRRLSAAARSADLLGAVLLGSALACVILAFATADPARQAVSEGGWALLPAAAVLAALFAWHESTTVDPLVDLASLARGSAPAALATSLLSGAALMAALVDVPIFARATAYPGSQLDAALVLVRFLVAVPIGAVAGGWLVGRVPERFVAGGGLVLSGAMFLVMTHWGRTSLTASWMPGGGRAPIGPSDVVLGLCGLGFGLVLAPVNASILGTVRPALHGVTSALVVVARTIGMLVGISALTAVGLRRFYQAQAAIPAPARLCPGHPSSCPAYDAAVNRALVGELHAIFVGAAACALAGGLVALGRLRSPGGSGPGLGATPARPGALKP